MSAQRPCVIVPTYDNPKTIRGVVERVRAFVPDVIVVDDGSSDEGRSAVAALAADGLATVVHRAENGGKGAAVKTGLRKAMELGFTHALQVDADGQHALEDAPKLLEQMRAEPKALVLASPIFDDSAPKGRLWARRITNFWTNIETGSRVIHDPMCGFRIYPVAAALATNATGDRMDFDPEVAVRMVWGGAPVINVPTKVHYVTAAEGGVSHFRMVQDNLLISWMHTRLCIGGFFRWLGRLLGVRR